VNKVSTKRYKRSDRNTGWEPSFLGLGFSPDFGSVSGSLCADTGEK
jgi:hypothetical protein